MSRLCHGDDFYMKSISSDRVDYTKNKQCLFVLNKILIIYLQPSLSRLQCNFVFLYPNKLVISN